MPPPLLSDQILNLFLQAASSRRERCRETTRYNEPYYSCTLPIASLEGRRYSFQLSFGAESAHATTFAMEGRRGTATSGHGALMTNKGRSATGEAPAGDGRISARRGAASHARPSSPSELDTFAHLELACDEMFEREPAWQSDDEDCMCREDECDDDDAMSSSLPTPTIGFVSLADDGTPSSFLTAPLRDDGCMSAVDHGFAARILQASPPTIPVKRERETSPVLGGDGTVVAAVAAIDIDLQSTRPLSLDADVHMAHGMLASAIPVTTTQIFGTRGKHSKKQRDDSCHPGEDNSDALSSSAASCVSASTNVSSASTVSAESCFSFVPYMHPTIAFQVSPSEMWRCKDCLILHPADYKGCGKCGEKRENIEEGPFQLPGGSALSAAGDWFGNQLPPAYPQNMCPTFAFSASGCMVAGAERSPWNVARSSDSQNTSRRGQNVKGNPQMQKTARDGQKHWHDKVQQVLTACLRSSHAFASPCAQFLVVFS